MNIELMKEELLGAAMKLRKLIKLRLILKNLPENSEEKGDIAREIDFVRIETKLMLGRIFVKLNKEFYDD